MSRSKPLHEQLYDAMLARIRSGTWREGDRVPSEQELIAEFGTSRAPIRQALATLRAQGAVDGGRGAPPRVRRIVPSQSFQTFMSFTQWAHSLGRVPGQRVIEGTRRPATDAEAAQLGIAHDDKLVEIVRLRFLDSEPAMLERSLFPFDVGVHLLAADLDAGSIYRALQDHESAPVRARHVIDAVAADVRDASVLAVPLGNPLLRVRRDAYDTSGRLVESADDRYLPSMATFAIENAVEQRSSLTREVPVAPVR
ncbi:MAG: GntR family transcriptional regulator [Actinomycetota bacterium]